ncbi:MAG: hypothetical protein MMC23_008230 [Stictis urceolatum]|nr:hypothetical protein [Stictis urceolata]
MISSGSQSGGPPLQLIGNQNNSSHCSALHSRDPLSAPPSLRSLARRFSSNHPFERPESQRNSLLIGEASPPPAPPVEHHPAFKKRRPRHVPIVITDGLIQSVLKDLPESPDIQEQDRNTGRRSIPLEEALQYSVKSLQRHPSSPHRPRHIPIVIPQFAQPFGPFPPTPADSGENTPRAQASPALGPSTPKLEMSQSGAGISRPSTADSTASATSPQRVYQGLSSYHSDLSASRTSLNDNSAETPHAEYQLQLGASSQYANASQQPGPGAPASASTSQMQNPPGTSLSGLVCNVHKCTGTPPHALVGATTTIVGDKLYVFGGRRLSRRRPQLTADLYKLDLLRRHWIKVETSGSIPPPRYFHSVCALGDNKLICYGGMSPASSQTPQLQNSPQPDQQPEVVVMSDIHIYDTKTRVWTHVPIADNPQGRYAHCATVLPSSAVFSSEKAPLSAIHNNPSSNNPNQGSIGVSLNGAGGAEMVVVGGQDSANTYIDQISVFNLRNLKWTRTSSFSRSCGAYRSVVAPLTGFPASKVGAGVPQKDGQDESRRNKSVGGPSSMLVYSNYNFLDVKLDLQIRTPEGDLVEKQMSGQFSPPGLRFPNGGVLDKHFVVSGTYLTSSKQEYALWALDLRTLTWSRIDTGGSTFTSGSWNRGVLWSRRNTFVILGDRRRSLVEDYNHRRINFNNVCFVELEAFGLYDNPRHASPTSAYVSSSASVLPPSLRPKMNTWTGGGRPHFSAAEELGQMAMGLKELSDMDISSISGERIPVNSHLLAKRWGPYFVHLLREGSNSAPGADSDTDTLRPPAGSLASRNSSITITPTVNTTYTASTLTSRNGNSADSPGFNPPNSANLSALTRSRTLHLPHTPLTIHALLHFFYTSSLPPANHKLSTPQILCSLLQIARPYRIDGLLEAVVERLHEVMDGRNAAAVFNASAMAAGGGRGTGFDRFGSVQLGETETHAELDASEPVRTNGASQARSGSRMGATRNVPYRNGSGPRDMTDSEDDGSSVDGSTSGASTADARDVGRALRAGEEEEMWSAERSCVIGLQKRGLRGLMEGRRMRERGRSVAQAGLEG